MAALRSGRQVRIIDGRTVNMWRLFHSLLKFWTPRQSTCSVQFCCSSQSGRHTHNHTASVLLSFPDLVASHSITWRPILLLFSSWTPLNSDAGVQSTLLSSFGRHLPDYMASVPAALPNLDASHTHHWRPILLLFSSWTPLNSDAGVQSTLLSSFGRHLPDYMASVLLSLSNLDATHSITWRPLRTPSPIWTPPTQSHGVHSAHLLQSGRLVSQHLASNLRFHRHLDAM